MEEFYSPLVSFAFQARNQEHGYHEHREPVGVNRMP